MVSSSASRSINVKIVKKIQDCKKKKVKSTEDSNENLRDVGYQGKVFQRSIRQLPSALSLNLLCIVQNLILIPQEGQTGQSQTVDLELTYMS